MNCAKGFTALFAMAILTLIISTAALAHEGESEIAEGKALFESGSGCDEMSDGQLEAVGEFLMEQMHPGGTHDAMHRMMGIEEGTPFHDRFHVNLAQAMYCSNKGTDAPLSTLDGGMMPMMRMMPMMSAMAGQGMMQGSAGAANKPYAPGSWNLFTVLYLILLIGLTGLVYLWLVRIWKEPKIRRGDEKEREK